MPAPPTGRSKLFDCTIWTYIELPSNVGIKYYGPGPSLHTGYSGKRNKQQLFQGAQVFTEANGINNKGAVVGAFFDPDTLRSFRLNAGSFRHFDAPGQGDTFAEAISDSNDVVGSYSDINLATHGFVSSGGVFRTVDFPGGNNSFALGVNASGQIVGEYFDDAGLTHSFLAERRTDDDNESGPDLHARPLPTKPNSCSDNEWDKHPERHRQPISCAGESSH
jgi:uncharacterized membrane protein